MSKITAQELFTFVGSPDQEHADQTIKEWMDKVTEAVDDDALDNLLDALMNVYNACMQGSIFLGGDPFMALRNFILLSMEVGWNLNELIRNTESTR